MEAISSLKSLKPRQTTNFQYCRMEIFIYAGMDDDFNTPIFNKLHYSDAVKAINLIRKVQKLLRGEKIGLGTEDIYTTISI